MRTIFISYRRNDSQGEAGRLFDDLAKHFGEDKVFMDVAAIEAGRDFRKAIDESVAKCGVLLVMIGPEWLTVKDENGSRRLDDSADFVRIETASALKRDIPVIPVLVRGTGMPRAEQLPEDLKELAYRNCIELTHARWKSDIQLLIDGLRRVANTDKPVIGRNESTASEEASSNAGLTDYAQIDPAVVQRISRELALHIGPIADIVVKRSAARCTSVEDLYRKVAEEIDSPDERERFLRASVAGVAVDPIPAHRDMATEAPSVPKGVKLSSATQKVAAQSNRGRSAALLAGGCVLLIAMLILGRRFASPHSDGSFQGTQTLPREAAESVPTQTIAPAPTESNTPAAEQDNSKASLKPRVAPDVPISEVGPIYPPLARAARIQGTVVLEADIAKDGTVEALRAVSGHPMLIPAAIDAVKKWRYKPALVNGVPTAVSTTIDVNFTLASAPGPANPKK